MIKNSKQLEVTKARLDEFRKAILALNNELEQNPILKKAQIDALRSSIEEFEREIKTYESLREGQLCAVMGGQFHEIARILIQIRIAKGWKQTDLAREIGIEPQQIQRYEATDYEGASLTRLYDIVDALEVPLSFNRIVVSKESFELNAEIDAVQNILIGRKELFKMTA